jgi:A/G-specific adenine glycosylase
MAFGLDEPALDGNIRRVLARVFNVQEPDRSPQGERRLWELAAGHLPPGRAGDYNQALMDLGARVCTPRQPACPACPVSQACQAYALGLQEQLPRRLPRRQTPHYQVAAAVIQRAGRVLIARRPENGLLGGLWEFPGGKRHPHESLAECLRREIGEELGAAIEVGDELGVYRHAFTHFRVTLHAFTARLVNGAQPQPHEHSALAWAAPDELGGFPMGKIDRQIAGDLLRQGSGRR